jgi:hypothetical protein
VVPAEQARGLPGTPRPFEHRWIAAATRSDASGRFRIEHVGEGDYLLIVMAGDRDFPLRRAPIPVSRSPRLIRLSRYWPERNLGEIDARPSALPPDVGATSPPGRARGGARS